MTWNTGVIAMQTRHLHQKYPTPSPCKFHANSSGITIASCKKCANYTKQAWHTLCNSRDNAMTLLWQYGYSLSSHWVSILTIQLSSSTRNINYNHSNLTLDFNQFSIYFHTDLTHLITTKRTLYKWPLQSHYNWSLSLNQSLQSH